MYRILSRTVLTIAGVALVVGTLSTRMVSAQALMTADAKAWMGDWTLTIQGGRGPQERTITFKDAGGKVAATLGAGRRGGPTDITDVSKKGNDVMLKFKQQGRGGETDVVMTLSMQSDGTLKVKQEANGNTQEGTGKKKES